MSNRLWRGAATSLLVAGGDEAAACPECGYDLRAAEPGRPCPECGQVPDRGGTRVPAGAVWTVSVTAGLALLLLITLYGVSSVLVQRFDDALGGTLPALNLPGPKLWAMPLLQRPIGNSPEIPGIIGTRTAMLSVLAIWLVTTRPPMQSDEPGGGGSRAEPLRLATRWASLVVFGASFGVLLSQQGLWPDDLPPYRVMLVCAAELPATALLYLYLRQLSARLPGQDRRRAFDLLVWAAPAVVAVGGMMLVFDWLAPDKTRLTRASVRLPIAAAYGTASVCAGVAAAAAVGWLTGAFALRAFPAVWRTLLGTRRWLRSLRRPDLSSPAGRGGARACAIAAGLVLLPVVMLMGIDNVGWFTARKGIAGNLPFYNYPGPKLWAAAALPELASRRSWEPVVSRSLLTILNLLAFWLVTVDPRRAVARGDADAESHAARLLRLAVRWLPVMLVGAMLGCAGVMRHPDSYEDHQLFGRSRDEFFGAVTVACELPATVLLYLHLALLSRRFGRPRLGAGLLAMSVLLVLLAGAGLSGFVLYRAQLGPSARSQPSVLAGSAAYGAIILVAAAWAVAAILALAWTVYSQRRSDRSVTPSRAA